MTEEPHFCDHPACWSTDTVAVMYPWWEAEDKDCEQPEPDRYFCFDHLYENGFCAGCGQFCAGFEAFHFIHPGYCEGCWDALNDDINPEEDDEDYWEY